MGIERRVVIQLPVMATFRRSSPAHLCPGPHDRQEGITTAYFSAIAALYIRLVFFSSLRCL